MATGNCSTCRWSGVDMGDADDFQLFVLAGDVVQSWPNVGSGDWCGEWQAPSSPVDSVVS